MSRKFLTAVDLAKNELQNAVVQNLAAAPSSPVKGQLYFDTSTNTLYWWNGTSWVAASPGSGFPGYGSVPQEQTFGASKADGVATTVARSDHGHGNPVHDDAAHSAVHLNALAPPTAAINMNGQYIQNLLSPVGASDAATKSYVDTAAQGLDGKASVRAASTANLTLSGTQTVDGVALVATDRVLVKNQTTTAQNGVYDVAAGAWTRSTDVDTWNELVSAYVWVEGGTTNADSGWLCTVDAGGTLNTTAVTWVQFSGAGQITSGAGLTKTGNTLDVGAGTGITVAADSVALDTTYTDGRYATVANGVKRFAANVGGSTSQAVTHNLGTKDVVVSVYRVASPFDDVECDVERTDTNNVTVRFTTAPAASEYRVVVLA